MIYKWEDFLEDLQAWRKKRGRFLTTSDFTKWVIYRRRDVAVLSVISKVRKAKKRGLLIGKIDFRRGIFNYMIVDWRLRKAIEEADISGTGGYSSSVSSLSNYLTKVEGSG